MGRKCFVDLEDFFRVNLMESGPNGLKYKSVNLLINVNFCTQYFVGACFRTNDCISAVWYRGNQPVALLRCSRML